MPHRPPRKKKKEPAAEGQSDQARAAQLAEQRRREMATRTNLSKFQNRSYERK